MNFNWRDLGVTTNGRMGGQIKTQCPKCSSDRTKKSERCLSVNLDDGVFQCHHCEWNGKAESFGQFRSGNWEKPRKVYRKPTYTPQSEPADKLLEWFAARHIPAEVVRRNKIERREVYFPATQSNQPAIAFPYFRDGQVINVQYRSAGKDFVMEKDAEPCLYGLDDIEDNEELYIVEGQLDKLAMESAGMLNCVSVPNGAGSNLDCFAADEARLAHVKRFFIAVDNDEKGKKLEADLVSRLGRDKCWLVEWPKGCKDANEVLIAHGIDGLCDAALSARPIPIDGAFEINDLREEIFSLYDDGLPEGFSPGWVNLGEHYRPALGQWTAVVAIPGSGKTAWLAALMVNMAISHDWKFCVFPAENLPAAQYASLLAEIFLGLPFNRGVHERMTREELDTAIDWLHDHFIILNPSDDELDLDSLLSMAKAYCLRRGIKGFVIDPWNELDHKQPTHQSETQYIAHSLIKVRRFAKAHSIHVWIVVHPTKMAKDRDGNYPVPTLYDASGSAHWRNKADFGIALYRHLDDDQKPVEVHVQKVRWKWCGKIGLVKLYFDKLTGRYSEKSPYGEYMENENG